MDSSVDKPTQEQIDKAVTLAVWKRGVDDTLKNHEKRLTQIETLQNRILVGIAIAASSSVLAAAFSVLVFLLEKRLLH